MAASSVMIKPVFAFAALVALTLPLLTGCASAGSTTCDEYAAMDNSDRQSTEAALLRAHDLESLSVDNSLGVTAAIDEYCGVSDNIIAGLPGSDAATQNNDSPIDNAANWSSETW